MHERSNLARRSSDKIDQVQAGAERLATALASTTLRTASAAAAWCKAAITARTIARLSALTGFRASLIQAMPPVTS
jgi:hypothetical protein